MLRAAERVIHQASAKQAPKTFCCLVVSVFMKIRLYHIAKLTSLELQKGSPERSSANSPLSGLLAHLNFHEQLCVNMVWGGVVSCSFV